MVDNSSQLHQLDLDSTPSISHNQTPIEESTLQNLDQETSSEHRMSNPSSKLPILLAVVAVTAGIGTGFGGAKLGSGNSAGGGLLNTGGGEPISRVAGETVNAGDVFGVQDEKTFKDSAEGYLEIGGLDGEGSHRLLRAGGASQTVYLTSSVTDLDKFKGMTVKVWGETNKAQKAGWLMDVGRVQVVNPQGQAPTEE